MSRSLRQILNEANANKLATGAQVARLGDVLTLTPKFVRGAVASHIMVLPEGAKAAALLSVYSVAGTLTGQLTPLKKGSAVATTQVSINALGNVVFAAADAVTEAEVTYISQEGELFSEVLTVDTGTDLAAPLASKKAIQLLEAESLAGTLTGALTVVARGTTPTTGQAAINDLGNIEFAAADNVTSCRVKYVATPGQGTAKDAVGPALDVVDKSF